MSTPSGHSARVVVVSVATKAIPALGPALANHEVLAASDARAALEIAAAEPVELLVVEADRIEDRVRQLCCSLKSQRQTAGVPIVLVAGVGASDRLPDLADALLVAPDSLALQAKADGLIRARRAEIRANLAEAALRELQADPPRVRVEQALRRREAQFQALIENVGSGVALADDTGRFTLYNRQFLRMFGLAPDSDVHKVNEQDWSAWLVLAESGQPLDVEDHPLRKAARMRAPVRNQLVGVRCPSQRRIVWMLVSAEPLLAADGRLEHLICTFHDVTERRRAEDSLRLANEQLREADRRKNEFIAVLSHELRNPLAPIRNSVYILERAAPGGPQARRALEVIDRQAGQLTRMVDDLLEVTRVSRGKIRLQREVLDLNKLVSRCAEDHRQVFENAGVSLTVEVPRAPTYVNGDPARLSQVVGNILGNAAKFTPRSGRATLSLEVEEERALIRVRDDGVGVAPELLQRLFEPFVQGDVTLDRSHGGLGLGLAISKGLAALHGGTLSAHSDGPGRGSEFTVTLPLTRGEDDRTGTDRQEAWPEGAKARRVLVIEDNADAAESLRVVLELHGHAVAVAATGPEGLTTARRLRPHVVLCDIGLPGMDGFEVGRQLRADPALAGTTLVALSGYALPEDVDRARDAGFDRHMAKPVDPGDLVGL